MLRSSSKQSENPCNQSSRRKEGYGGWEGSAEKGGFKPGMKKREWAMEY